MRKGILLVLAISILLSGCSLGNQKSAIEIITYPATKVFLDGKEAGMSPYKNNTLKPGDIEVKLVADNGGTFTKKVHLENGANTVVNRELSGVEGKNGGYLLYLEPTGEKEKSGILITSRPDRASIAIDGEIKGFSPLRLDDIGEGDKQVTISYPGNKTIDVFVRAINGYQLVVESDLALEELAPVVTAPTPTDYLTSQEQTQIIIKETGTGWLRVRASNSADAIEITKVTTGKKFVMLDMNEDWIKIEAEPGKIGWISAKYAEKL
ncbi:PEGA domain-containing protein [Candidatus Shapirobacteria bacterium]|nr:PEGA domain-containing protein [Candidatus Shapirobacteria bacterium]